MTLDPNILFAVGSVTARTLARRAGVSLNTLRWQLWQQGVSAQREATRHAGMSAAEVASALGVDPATVYRWAARGWLKASYGMALTARHYTFDADDVSAFLFGVGGLIPHLRPDPSWRDEVHHARAALHARYIRGSACMDLLARPQQHLAYLRRKHGFPAPALRMGAIGDYYDRARVRSWLDDHPSYQTSAAKEI